MIFFYKKANFIFKKQNEKGQKRYLPSSILHQSSLLSAIFWIFRPDFRNFSDFCDFSWFFAIFSGFSWNFGVFLIRKLGQKKSEWKISKKLTNDRGKLGSCSDLFFTKRQIFVFHLKSKTNPNRKRPETVSSFINSADSLQY